MELKLKRELKNDIYTLGTLSIDGKIFCYTVEDAVRELKDTNKDGDFDDLNEGKIFGKTAIPFGKYSVMVTFSPHFKKDLPLVMNVPGFSGVRIHSGNTAADSEGCIIIGQTREPNGVGLSRICFTKFMEKLKGQSVINLTIE